MDRLINQQTGTFKSLLQKRLVAVHEGSCRSEGLCIGMGNKARLLPKLTKCSTRVSGTFGSKSDTDPDYKLGQKSFPPGTPLPPTSQFPAELECPYCFQVKSFHKPSDWTKHIHSKGPGDPFRGDALILMAHRGHFPLHLYLTWM